jgi:3D (Asp-Asp-Asp) domain-containing protein
MSKAKAKGTSVETAVVKFLIDNGFPYAERRALNGALDLGDITGTPALAWEVKNHKTYKIPAWLKETELETKNAKADFEEPVLALNAPDLILFQENSLAPISSPADPPLEVVRKINVVITGYSSSIWETDESPFTTAAGTSVRDGVIDNNYLPFGTKIRIPELYGDKVFVVEDRMNWQKGNYHFDIWFSNYREAKDFGAKWTYIVVLEG